MNHPEANTFRGDPYRSVVFVLLAAAVFGAGAIAEGCGSEIPCSLPVSMGRNR